MRAGLWQRAALAAGTIALVSLSTGAARAHLIPAQQGTVNVVGAGVFTVLSVPTSAIQGADDDHDGRIDVQELARHEEDLRAELDRRLTILDGTVPARTVRVDLMLSPQHDGAAGQGDQIVVLKHAELDAPPRDLHVRCDLFGAGDAERSFSITATRHPASGTETQVGTLALDAPDLAFFAPAAPPSLPVEAARRPRGYGATSALVLAAAALAMAMWSRAKKRYGHA